MPPNSLLKRLDESFMRRKLKNTADEREGEGSNERREGGREDGETRRENEGG